MDDDRDTSMTDFVAVARHLHDRFNETIVRVVPEAMDPWVEVAPDALVEVCRETRDEPSLRFEMLSCITVVDYLEVEAKKTAPEETETVDRRGHLEVVYHLLSLARRDKLVLKVTLPRWKEGVVDSLPELPSVSSIWRTALWHEREVYDLSGVWFVGHPELRRILCPEDWTGHPLRKDYEAPQQYHDIRGR